MFKVSRRVTSLWLVQSWVPLFKGLFLVFVMLLAGCGGEQILYSEKAEIGGMGWSHTDSIRFPFTAQDTSQHYDLWLEVTHDAEYTWENAYVNILTEFPGDSVKSDIVSLELSDGAGGWQGRCSGDACRLNIPLQRNLRFPSTGDYALTFVQYMRQDVVPGILGLKLTVAKAEKAEKAE